MSREPSGRQYINYSFFKFLPAWYLLTKKKKSDLWSKLVQHLESEDCWVYEDMIELYLETDDGIKEYTSDF